MSLPVEISDFSPDAPKPRSLTDGLKSQISRMMAASNKADGRLAACPEMQDTVLGQCSMANFQRVLGISLQARMIAVQAVALLEGLVEALDLDDAVFATVVAKARSSLDVFSEDLEALAVERSKPKIVTGGVIPPLNLGGGDG